MMRRYRESGGQGLLEVVVVLVLFAAAVAAAVPAYLGFQDRQASRSTKAHLLAAVPMAQAYRQDHGSYKGMNAVDLLKIDPRVSPTLTVAWARRGSYCLTDNTHGKTWSIRGPFQGDPRYTPNDTCA